jgi:hypothetical protein
VLIGTDFWKDLLKWMRKVMDEQFQTISPEDFDLFSLTDDVDEAVNIIYESHIGKRKIAERLPRFAGDEEELAPAKARAADSSRAKAASAEGTHHEGEDAAI